MNLRSVAKAYKKKPNSWTCLNHIIQARDVQLAALAFQMELEFTKICFEWYASQI